MIVTIIPEAEEDLEAIFNYYQLKRGGLGVEFLHEFRSALALLIQYPLGWQALDDSFRRLRLHRFPYGIIYRADLNDNVIIIEAVIHLARGPEAWPR